MWPERGKPKQGWVTGNRSDVDRHGKARLLVEEMILIFGLLICSCWEKYPVSDGNKHLGLLDSHVENGCFKELLQGCHMLRSLKIPSPGLPGFSLSTSESLSRPFLVRDFPCSVAVVCGFSWFCFLFVLPFLVLALSRSPLMVDVVYGSVPSEGHKQE